MSDTHPHWLRWLRPETLARLVLDLEEAAEDWAVYPEEAPPPAQQQTIQQLVTAARAAGQTRAQALGQDFGEVLQRLAAAQDEADWLAERNRQDRENWYQDYQ